MFGKVKPVVFGTAVFAVVVGLAEPVVLVVVRSAEHVVFGTAVPPSWMCF